MRLDCMIVNPPSRSGVYGGLAELSAIEIPVWGGLLAAYLRRQGYGVELLDCEAEYLNAAEGAEVVNQLRPRLAVFPVYGQQPSASTQCMPAAEAMAGHMHGARVVLGTHASALPERTLEGRAWTGVCVGEGPHTLRALLGTGDLAQVPGLCYFEGGKPQRTAPAPLIENLDAELGDRGFDFFDFGRYRAHNWHAFGYASRSPYASLQTSLGCPFRCSFCCINAPFGSARMRCWSPKNVLEAFERLAEAGVTHVKIPDEMFVLNAAHVEAICDGLIERGHRFNLWAYARVDTVKDRLLEKLKRAGFNWLGIGIESGSKHVRDGVAKGRFGEGEIYHTVARIRMHGIAVAANYIFGLPDDTHETMRETFRLACDLNTEWANFYCAMAYPGSPLHGAARERGWRLPEDPGGPGWIGYSQHAPESLPLPTETLTAEQVLDYRDSAFLGYFDRPMYRNMLRARFGESAVAEVERMLAYGAPRRRHREDAADPRGPAEPAEHSCAKCGTVYFREQECDWCPGEIARRREAVSA